MAQSDWQERLVDLVVDVCGEEEVRDLPEADLFEEGLLDSMAAIELLIGIEQEFGVSIAPTELDRDQMNTLQKIVARVGERIR